MENGIEATKRLLQGLKRAMVFGYFLLHDGLGADDLIKVVSNISAVTDIIGDFSQMPAVGEEVKDLTLLEISELNIAQAEIFHDGIKAIKLIQETGTYKTLKRAA